MDLLLEKARLVFDEQDWSTWEWSTREYGTRHPRVIALAWRDGATIGKVTPPGLE